MILTDELFADETGLVKLLGGARVILSTLSILSNPALAAVGLFSLVPVQRLVVDEASDINAFEYMVSFLTELLFLAAELNTHLLI